MSGFYAIDPRANLSVDDEAFGFSGTVMIGKGWATNQLVEGEKTFFFGNRKERRRQERQQKWAAKQRKRKL